MKICYDILFSLGCAAVFIALASIVWFIIEVFRGWKAEMEYLDNVEKFIDEIFLNSDKENEGDENADKS